MTEYIEREAVIEFIRSYRCSTDVAFHMGEHLNEIPAADVRPVKRGKWTKEYLQSTRGGTYSVDRCSECGASFPMYDGTPYCPNCGADMRPQPTKEET